MTQGHQGPGGEQRFPSATWVVEYDSRLLFKDRGKIEPKKIPSCLIPYQLVVCTWQLEIFSNSPMTILREAMTRYSHTGKPVEGNQDEKGRGKNTATVQQEQPTWDDTMIQLLQENSVCGILPFFIACLVACLIYTACMKSNVGYYGSTYPHNDHENFIPSRKKLVLERI